MTNSDWLKITLKAPVELADFARNRKLMVRVTEGTEPTMAGSQRVFVADFYPMLEIKDGVTLGMPSGHGPTVDAALVDLCRHYTNKLCVLFGTSRDKRQDFWAPTLQHTIKAEE